MPTIFDSVADKLSGAESFGDTVGSANADASAWDVVTDQLLDMMNLKPDWDGDGAPAPARESVADACLLIAALRRSGNCPAPSRAVPSLDGTVVIEWQRPGVLSELEFGSSAQVVGTIHRTGGPTEHVTFEW